MNNNLRIVFIFPDFGNFSKASKSSLGQEFLTKKFSKITRTDFRISQKSSNLKSHDLTFLEIQITPEILTFFLS